jgi:transposase
MQATQATEPDALPADSAEQTTVEELMARLQADNAALRDALATSQEALTGAQETITQLRARIDELERRLGLNSANSGKPPSSDGLKKPARKKRTMSLRESSKRPSGGQPGHPGETLRPVPDPTHVVEHYPSACQHCAEPFSVQNSLDYQARQVFDLPPPPPLDVTEHRAHRCECAQCGASTRAEFPDGVTAPVQYGPRLMGIVVYLLHAQFIPEDRLVELMADLFGVKLAAATLASFSTRCAQRFQGFVASVCEAVKTAAVKHLDETGFRIGKQLHWLHVATTEWLTVYRFSPKRGSLLEGLRGICVHDHWKPYYTLEGVVHALCNAHHLRELKALVEFEQESWARRLQRLLRRACHAVNLARARGEPLPPRLVKRFQRHYDAIVAEGLAFHEALPPLPPKRVGGGKPRGRPRRRTGHNLLLRLQTRREDVLRFLTDPRVPFTNNLAEQALRMMKLRQKISGGFRCEQGAATFATLRSLIATAKKQGWNVIEVFTQSPDSLLAKLRVE